MAVDWGMVGALARVAAVLIGGMGYVLPEKRRDLTHLSEDAPAP